MSDTSLLQQHLTLSMRAVNHTLQRMQADPRLAYLIGPGSETFNLLTAAAAVHSGSDGSFIREQISSKLKTQTVPPIGLDCVDADISDEDSGLPVDDEMIEFVEALTFWHTTKINRLSDIQAQVEAGVTLKMGRDDKDGAVLSKRDAALFKAGMEAVLIEFKKLPFTVSNDAEDNEEGA